MHYRFILRSLAFLLQFCACFYVANAQITISGSVSDQQSNRIRDVYVLLLNPQDSSMVNFKLTDEKGNYTFSNQLKQNYILQFSHSAYVPVFMYIPSSGTLETYLAGLVKLTDRITELKEVVVTDDSPMRMNGDTMEFNPKAFKVDQHATLETLLRGLPGFEVSENGAIKFEKKTIEVLTINGQRFFSDDPRVATRNLPVNAVARVQVFESKTRKSEITGLDDGVREKRVNIKLKKEYKNTWFGREEVGYGAPDRHKVSIGLNRFNERHQFGLIGMTNNLNLIGLNEQQYSDFTGRSATNINELAMYSGLRSLPGALLIFPNDYLGFQDGEKGQRLTRAGGLNYNYQYLKTKFFSTFYYDNTRYWLTQNNEQDNFVGDKRFRASSWLQNDSQTGDFKVLLRAYHDFGPKDRLFADVGIQLLKTDKISSGQTEVSDQLVKNSSKSAQTGVERNQRYTATLIYSHQFAKPSRALSISQSLHVETNGNRLGQQIVLRNDADLILNRNRQLEIVSNPYRHQANLGWMEPISPSFKLQPFYNFGMIRDQQGRATHDFNDGSYQMIDSLSYQYNYRLGYHRLGSTLFFTPVKLDDKLKIDLTVARQWMVQQASLIDRIYDQEKDYQNWIYEFGLQFSSPNDKYISNANFNNKIELLSVDQLIPITLNDDPLYLTSTNPDLMVERLHSFNWINFLLIKNWNRYISLNFNRISYFSQNVATRSVDSTLVTFTQFESMRGSNSNSLSIEYQSLAGLKNEKRENEFKPRYTIGYRLNAWDTPSRLNGIQSLSKGREHTAEFSINWRVSAIWSINPSYSYSLRRYTGLQTYQTNTVSVVVGRLKSRVDFTPTTYFTLNTMYRVQNSRTFGYKVVEPVIDFSINRTFPKLKGMVLSLGVYDVLNRRVGSDFSSSAIGSIDRFRTNTIRRYALLSLAYNFKKNPR